MIWIIHQVVDRTLRAEDPCDQCRAAGVVLFVKQMARREAIPDDLMIREFPLNNTTRLDR